MFTFISNNKQQLTMQQSIKVFFLLLNLSYFISCSSKEEINQYHPYQFSNNEEWKKLTVREKVGQIICFNYSQQVVDENGGVKKFLEKYPIGSTFLASWSIKNDVQEYRNIVSSFSEYNKYPMLFSEDFENGLGGNFNGYTSLAGEMALGAVNTLQSTRDYTHILSSEARSIGINWLLHPVADLNTNPVNFLTNVRATGDKVDLALNILPEQIRIMQKNGISATAKHFPGDGTDIINQHFATSSMKLSYQEWENQHGKVLRKVIEEGVHVIMAGHITFPDYQKDKLDGEYLLATLSKELMEGLLKKKLGFNGIVVSDALNMGGMAGYYKNQLETEVECFKAGADILLWPSLSTMDSIVARVERGIIPMERLDAAVSRVWSIKNELGLFNQGYPLYTNLSSDQRSDHHQKAQEIANKSITLVSNKHNILPIHPKSHKNLLLIYVSEQDVKEKLSPLKEGLVQDGFSVDELITMSAFQYGGNLEEMNEKYDAFLFVYFAKPGAPWGTLGLNKEQALSMWSSNMLPRNKVISIGIGDPYKNLLFLPQIHARINCYNDDIYSLNAVVEGITGKLKMTGISPVL